MLRSARWSVGAQLGFGALSLIGFAATPTDQNEVLFHLIIADLAVQAIELSFYLLLLFREGLPTFLRYADWFVSTPLMIISLLVFNAYTEDASVSIPSFFASSYDETIPILALNACMLACGLCLELLDLGAAARRAVLAAGFAFFVATYAWIFASFVETTASAVLTGCVFVVWSGYGVAAWWEDATKQIAYNALDVVSKNVYGLFVSVYLLAEG